MRSMVPRQAAQPTVPPLSGPAIAIGRPTDDRRSRVGADTRRLLWLTLALLPLAAITASAAPWSRGFVLTYVVAPILLRLLIRLDRAEFERFVQILGVVRQLASGSAVPFRWRPGHRGHRACRGDSGAVDRRWLLVGESGPVPSWRAAF